jgi:CheY-like chemotaxis protein
LFEAQAHTNAQLTDAVRRMSQTERRKDELLATLGLRVQLQPTEVAPVLDNALREVRSLIDASGQRVVLDVAGGLGVEADPVRLQQILARLLANASSHTETGGRIVVAAARHGECVVIAIEEARVGPLDDLQPDVRTLVRLHGGELVVHGDRRVTIELSACSLTVEAELASRMRTVPGRQVLVVDDNVDAAEMLADALREAGYEVAVAHDGPGALTLAQELRPEVAVLDIGLPVMDGYEVARQLRARLGDGTVRLIAVTGYAQPQDVARGRAAGFERHLRKPVDLATLLEALC